MPHKINDESIDKLFKAVLTLKNVDECYDFFEDLCTMDEIQVFAKRLRAAEMIMDEHVYSDISSQTGLSTATISRVNRALKYGNDGYKMVLSRLEENKE